MSDETCFVYIIAHMKGRNPCAPVKVGISSDPQKRLASLQTANPKRLVLLCTFAAPDRTIAKSLEEAFHHVMADRRLTGEWFDIAPFDSVSLMCSNVRSALNHFFSDDPDMLAAASAFSGLIENEQKLSEWFDFINRRLNDNDPRVQ